MNIHKFSCPRTCLDANPWCRFNPIFRALGNVDVHSHTVRVKVEYRDPGILETAVKAMGGTWLGLGSHRLYGGLETGQGFTLPDWRYSLVLGADGELHYDDYNGCWGNVQDLERLKGLYALSAAQKAATAQGWQSELTQDCLTIYHPSGGLLTVSAAGSVETAGFQGNGCHEAREALGLERLGLIAGQSTPTAEANAIAAVIQVPAK